MNTNNKTSQINSSLRLFNAVLEDASSTATATDYEQLDEYGVVIAPSAIHNSKEIRSYLKQAKVSGKQMNQTFYSSAEEVQSKTLAERLTDQLTHYFTTYGLRAMGLGSDFMYVPNDWEKTELPDQIKFQVIVGATANELIGRCLSMLESGMAMKQETIEDVINVLDYCSYKLTGHEIIKNREAQVLIADKTGVLPVNSDALFRYLMFKATGQTMPIKNKDFYTAITISGYRLPQLTNTHETNLAISFNRRKEFWMALKKANKFNASVINRISKKSKKYHRPVPVNVLSSLTSKQFLYSEIQTAAKQANAFQLIRSMNALRAYEEYQEVVDSSKEAHRIYQVRNGKAYVKKASSYVSKNVQAYNLLWSEISSLIDKQTKVYIPEGVRYTLPTSEKQFVGNVPTNSSIVLDPAKGKIIAGIYWENGKRNHVDIDLSCDSLAGDRVGWNSRWHNSELVFSGDITNAPSGASEWFTITKGVSSSWLLSANVFSGGASEDNPIKAKIMVGYEPNDKVHTDWGRHYIDPNDVLFTAEVEFKRRGLTLGMISPYEQVNGPTLVRFTLLNSSVSNRCVTSGSQSVNLISAMLPKIDSALCLNDFLNVCEDPDEAEIDLSPNALAKDSLLNLIKTK